MALRWIGWRPLTARRIPPGGGGPQSGVKPSGRNEPAARFEGELATTGDQTAGDQACLAAFQRELDFIYATLRRLGVGSSDVDDLAQEVYLALRHAWADLDLSRPLRPYLFGVAFRIVGAYRRKHKRVVTVEVVDVLETAPPVDEALQAKQARAILQAALERIPLDRRAVLIMHDLDEVPATEIAAALKLPRFTIYTRLRKARKELATAVRRLMRKSQPR